MKPLPPSLATHLASLRDADPAPSGAGRRIMSKSLDALIAAIFARIFARLEQILRLWQSGKLPPPPIRPQTSPCTNRSFAPRRATKPGFRPRSPIHVIILRKAKDPRFLPHDLRARHRAPARPHARPTLLMPQAHPIAPSRNPPRARAPPAPNKPHPSRNTPQAGPYNHGKIDTISKHLTPTPPPQGLDTTPHMRPTTPR